MRRPATATPSVLQGVAVAGALALAGAAVFSALGTMYPAQTALQAVIGLTSGAYVIYLLTRSPLVSGRIVALVCWGITAAGAALFIPSTGALLAVHVVLVWLIRTVCYHARLISALADLGLAALGLAAAIWAAHSSASLALSIWCLFLVQALFVLLPAFASPSTTPTAGNAQFDRAQRSAEAALRRLISMH